MTATALCRHSNASMSIPASRSSTKKPPPIALGMRIPTKECGITGREAGFAKWATYERRILIQQGAFSPGLSGAPQSCPAWSLRLRALALCPASSRWSLPRLQDNRVR